MGTILDVVYITGEDWEGLYIHGQLVNEGHCMSFRQGFEIRCKYINEIENVSEIDFSIYNIDQIWLEGIENLPKKLEDIPSDMLEKMS